MRCSLIKLEKQSVNKKTEGSYIKNLSQNTGIRTNTIHFLFSGEL